MDITVVGRNAEIHPNFREYVRQSVEGDAFLPTGSAMMLTTPSKST